MARARNLVASNSLSASDRGGSPQSSQSGSPAPFTTPIEGIPAQRARTVRSWVWDYGSKFIHSDGKEYWKCSPCESDGHEIIYLHRHGPTNASKHLRGHHGIVPDDEKDEEEPEEGSVYTQILHSKSQFNVEVFRWKLLRCIAVLHLPFSIVEHDEFRDLFLYCSPHLRRNDALPKSGTSIKNWMVELFILHQAFMVALLEGSHAMVHISFDLWTSPNHYCMLGVVCHFIDKWWINRTVLLALKPLKGAHCGVNIGNILITVLKAYALQTCLGFCVTDNAGDNDTSMVSVQVYLSSLGITWIAEDHRLRCLGHVINLIANAFIANKTLKVRAPPRPKGAPKPLKPKVERPIDCITKIHEIVKYISAPGQRQDEFLAGSAELHIELLRPVRDQDTRWFSIYLMLVRAVLLKDSIDLFVSRHIVSKRPDEKNLAEWVMTSDDWLYCTDVIAFMKPMYFLLKGLEGKNENG